MVSSPGFVSTPCNLIALFRLAFATAPPVTGLTLLQRVTRRLILQKARRHPFLILKLGIGLRLIVGTWFQILFHSAQPRFFSPFPHGTSSLSVTKSI